MMMKNLNISVTTPSKAWESIRNKLLKNNFIASERQNSINFMNDLHSSPVLNEKMNLVDNYELNRVDYN
ncbi:MAG: hypothetical protein WC799_20410 [Desulfobacteraceae bacterium]|jgi:hypothetical protein